VPKFAPYFIRGHIQWAIGSKIAGEKSIGTWNLKGSLDDIFDPVKIHTINL
jgi:hypothetical protein